MKPKLVQLHWNCIFSKHNYWNHSTLALGLGLMEFLVSLVNIILYCTCMQLEKRYTCSDMQSRTFTITEEGYRTILQSLAILQSLYTQAVRKSLMADVPVPSRWCLRHHAAARLKDCIVIVSCYRPECEKEDVLQVWTYNLWTEEWKQNALITRSKQNALTHLNGDQLPQGLCMVALGSSVYIHGGRLQRFAGIVWKLTGCSNDCFALDEICIEDYAMVPSPRLEHCGWEHGKKLWIFGGHGKSPVDYLNDYGDFVVDIAFSNDTFGKNNQLFCYDPSIQMWKNVECFGDIPSPRSHASTAIIKDMVWLYGGKGQRYVCKDDLYELNMTSHLWTQIHTDMPRPEAFNASSFTIITASQLVLTSYSERLSWIFDVDSYVWKQPAVLDAVHSCYNQSSTTGLNSDIVVIRGKTCEPSCQQVHHSYVHFVMLEPKSLQQLAMKTIHQNRSTLPWRTLPSQLIRKLEGWTA